MPRFDPPIGLNTRFPHAQNSSECYIIDPHNQHRTYYTRRSWNRLVSDINLMIDDEAVWACEISPDSLVINPCDPPGCGQFYIAIHLTNVVCRAYPDLHLLGNHFSLAYEVHILDHIREAEGNSVRESE